MKEEHKGEVLNFLEVAIATRDKERVWEIFTQAHVGSKLKEEAEKAFFELCVGPEDFWKLHSCSRISVEMKAKTRSKLKKFEPQRQRARKMFIPATV